MKVKTTSVAYDDNGKILASYDSEDSFNAAELDEVLEEMRVLHNPTEEDIMREIAKENLKRHQEETEKCGHCEDCNTECPLLTDDKEFDDECEDFDGDEILHLEVSLDALKIVGAVAGGFIGLKVLHKLAKAVF